jgi:phosphohistidine phosphatase
VSAVRHVILVRHAHAEWPEYNGRDFDRPLTSRGLDDARRTAEAIKDAGLVAGLLLTSPARRTLQTAGFIATTLGLSDQAVQPVQALYNAPAGILHNELRNVAAAARTVILVAHNPGISELARMLTGNTLLPPFDPGQWQFTTLET